MNSIPSTQTIELIGNTEEGITETKGLIAYICYTKSYHLKSKSI